MKRILKINISEQLEMKTQDTLIIMFTAHKNYGYETKENKNI